jgi:hypothetical protein
MYGEATRGPLLLSLNIEIDPATLSSGQAYKPSDRTSSRLGQKRVVSVVDGLDGLGINYGETLEMESSRQPRRIVLVFSC